MSTALTNGIMVTVKSEYIPERSSLSSRQFAFAYTVRIENQGGETILSGTLPDQSALHGILDKVRDLGLSIIAVRRLPPQRGGGEP